MDGVQGNSNPAHKKAIQRICAMHDKTITESFFRKNISGRTNRNEFHLYLMTLQIMKLIGSQDAIDANPSKKGLLPR